MKEISERIQAEAHRLLQDKQVDVLIGYRRGFDRRTATPCFVTDPTETKQLIFDESCSHNLARYLVGREGYLSSRRNVGSAKPRVGVVARPATLRTMVGLIQEHQFAREDVVVLGIVDGSTAGLAPDIEVGQIGDDSAEQAQLRADLAALEAMTLAERAAWWRAEFAKCIRCYACRQVCPFCYCEQCLAEENQPQWIDRSPSPANNQVWHIIRAFHLTGRCTECGECDRVCPMQIPLRLLMTKMAGEVHDTFDYVAGADMGIPLPVHLVRAAEPAGVPR